MSESHLESAQIEYITECEESFARVEQALTLLNSEAPTRERLDLVYREIHTIKGSSQLFGFKHIADVAHVMENVLEPLRKQVQAPGPALADALFRGLDAMELMVTALRSGEPADVSVLVAGVIAQLDKAAPAGAEGQSAPAPVSAPALQAVAPAPAPAPAAPVAPVAVMAPVAPVAAAIAPVAPVVSAPQPAPVAKVESAPKLEAVHKTEAPAAAAASGADAAESSTVRVSVSLLDKLMTLMGEMVLVRNQVLQFSNRSDDLEFLNLSQRLDVVTSEIQGEVMKTRMQPVGNVVTKFQRVVRELSRELGKKIDLSFSGMETELDRTLLEAVKDPIMHIVRNSCDHGLETPDERRSAGKSETGTIAIHASHEGGQVVVKISDDGRGLDRDRIVAKALENKLVSPEAAANLSERDAFQLIFAPGFSTAKQVTNVSGRGVGMDVVRSNIEGIGGMVELNSQLGRGTTLSLKIPLTLAIVPAMIVRLQNTRFVIPQVKLVELVRVEEGGETKIESLQGRPVYRLRGDILPLVSLSEVLGLKVDAKNETTNIAVLNAEGVYFGLILDEVQDTAEVVVKPLGSFLKNLTIYSGATVLGDGSVALILDVQGIAMKQKLTATTIHPARAVAATRSQLDLQEFLVVRLQTATKHAIPLNLVHRLEEVAPSAIEMSGLHRVMRYRDSVLPLIWANEMMGFEAKAPVVNENGKISIIVSQKAGKGYGIVVDEIVDVLTTHNDMVDPVSVNPMILGNLVEQDGIVVILDVLHMMDAFGGTMAESHDPKKRPAVGPRRVLFAEDTAFFRRHVSALLEKEGYDVTTADNGKEALARLTESADQPFDLVLSDIEMPQMDGLSLVKAIRANPAWADLPVVALTTKFNPAHQTEGLAAGFTAYLEKLKSDVLLYELASHLSAKQKRRAG